jgi:hypothetical protein
MTGWTMVTRKRLRAGVAAIALLIGAALLPMLGLSREHVRDLRLVALDKTFYLEGQPAPNPTLVFRAGERVRLVLRNEDDGMRHDLKIRDWNIAVPPIDGKGERAVTFRVPGRPGTASYACTPHAASMAGSIEVE